MLLPALLLGGCSRAQIFGCDASACARDSGADARDAAADAGPRYRLEGAVTRGEEVGGAGAGVYELACAENEIVVGHDGRESNQSSRGLPYGVRLRCAELSPSGALANERALADVAGWNPAVCPETAPGEWLQSCREGSVVVGLHGELVRWRPTTLVVARLGLTCAPLARWIADGVGEERMPYTTSNEDAAEESFALTCPPGQVVTAVYGTDGCYIDSIRIGCRRVARD